MRTRLTFISHSPSQTKKIGERLGRKLQAGDVVALQGELGAGKTTLAKGLAKGLGVRTEKSVCSPTFVLIHEYQGREKIYHLDWYRLRSVRDADEDLARECFQAHAVTLVEWPERGRRLLPAQTLRIRLSHQGRELRRLQFLFPAQIRARLRRALKAK